MKLKFWNSEVLIFFTLFRQWFIPGFTKYKCLWNDAYSKKFGILFKLRVWPKVYQVSSTSWTFSKSFTWLHFQRNRGWHLRMLLITPMNTEKDRNFFSPIVIYYGFVKQTQFSVRFIAVSQNLSFQTTQSRQFSNLSFFRSSPMFISLG